MYLLDKEKARNVLANQNLNPYQIEQILKRFPPLPDNMGGGVDRWLTDQAIPDINIDGISLKEVMEKHGSHFLIALKDLARLLDPELTAEKRSQWRRILTNPVYYE